MEILKVFLTYNSATNRGFWLRFVLASASFFISIKRNDAKKTDEITSNHELKYEDCNGSCEGPPRLCHFKFTVRHSVAMSTSCGDCPFNETHCYAKGCITAGGYVRPVITTNNQLPGPSIQVCEGDTIEVEVTNGMPSEATTIHWHGLRQRGTPFMDGVPFITQCPIMPNARFVYQFIAHPAGTHLWHGHTGLQEADGLFGALVIRKKETPDIRNLYDFDLPEHVIIIWHWFAKPAHSELLTFLHLNGTVDGHALIINGKGRGKQFNNGHMTAKTPLEEFQVQQGKKYRFRVVVNTAIYCPIQLSVDSHTLLVFAGDADTFEPVEADSMMVNAGERYDFVLNANQTPDCYWLRTRGLGDCLKSKVHQEALICYDGESGSKDHSPSASGNRLLRLQEETDYDAAIRKGRLFNVLEEITGNWPRNESIRVANLQQRPKKSEESYGGAPDHLFYLQVSVKSYPDSPIRGALYPQINNISFQLPASSILGSDRKALQFCDSSSTHTDCISQHCSCTHLLKVGLGSLVEMVFYDSSNKERNQDHPFHLHGHSFRVVSSTVVGCDLLREDVELMNLNGTLVKNLRNAPLKDTFSVPNKGIAVIRIKADNPGFWLMHCHVSNHMELGMALVLQVGEIEEIPSPPQGFPTCGNWPNKQKNFSNLAAALPNRILFLIIVFLPWTLL